MNKSSSPAIASKAEVDEFVTKFLEKSKKGTPIPRFIKKKPKSYTQAIVNIDVDEVKASMQTLHANMTPIVFPVGCSHPIPCDSQMDCLAKREAQLNLLLRKAEMALTIKEVVVPQRQSNPMQYLFEEFTLRVDNLSSAFRDMHNVHAHTEASIRKQYELLMQQKLVIWGLPEEEQAVERAMENFRVPSFHTTHTNKKTGETFTVPHPVLAGLKNKYRDSISECMSSLHALIECNPTLLHAIRLDVEWRRLEQFKDLNLSQVDYWLSELKMSRLIIDSIKSVRSALTGNYGQQKRQYKPQEQATRKQMRGIPLIQVRK